MVKHIWLKLAERSSKHKKIRMHTSNHNNKQTKTNNWNHHTAAPMLADGSIPILPLTIAASSDNISPNKLFVKMVSNCKIRSVNGSNYFHSILINKSLEFGRPQLICRELTAGESKYFLEINKDLFWITQKLHCSIINIHMWEFNIRILCCHFCDSSPPKHWGLNELSREWHKSRYYIMYCLWTLNSFTLSYYAKRCY